VSSSTACRGAQGRTFLKRQFGIAKILFELDLARNRAGFRGHLQGVAKLHLGGDGRDLFGKFSMDGFFDQEPGAGNADLAGIAENAVGGHFRRLVDIGRVGENHIRRFAAEFEIDAFEIGTRRIFQSRRPTGPEPVKASTSISILRRALRRKRRPGR